MGVGVKICVNCIRVSMRSCIYGRLSCRDAKRLLYTHQEWSNAISVYLFGNSGKVKRKPPLPSEWYRGWYCYTLSIRCKWVLGLVERRASFRI